MAEAENKVLDEDEDRTLEERVERLEKLVLNLDERIVSNEVLLVEASEIFKNISELLQGR
jgi:hypothetical protein